MLKPIYHYSPSLKLFSLNYDLITRDKLEHAALLCRIMWSPLLSIINNTFAHSQLFSAEREATYTPRLLPGLVPGLQWPTAWPAGQTQNNTQIRMIDKDCVTVFHTIAPDMVDLSHTYLDSGVMLSQNLCSDMENATMA